jgi:pyruvate carboxylase
MPGMVATVKVSAGQKVVKGDALISIEAMKMETMVRSEFDAVVGTVHVKLGIFVDAKDLLLELTRK